MAMQTIFRTQQVEQYTVLSNAILNPSISGLSLRASALLISLLSKPKDWIVNPEYMAASGVESLYIIRQTLRELREFGYVIFKRLSSGCTDWFVYDSPQNSKENIHSTPIKSTAEQPVKPSTKTAEIASIPPVVEIEAEIEVEVMNKTAEPATVKAEKSSEPIVPSSPAELSPEFNNSKPALNEDLLFSSILTAKQQQHIKTLLKEAPYALQPAILNVLCTGLENGTIKLPFAYLKTLVNKANNGEFEVPIAKKTSPIPLSHIPFSKQADHLPKIDNIKYFIDLYLRLGEVALKSMPKDYKKQVLAAVGLKETS